MEYFKLAVKQKWFFSLIPSLFDPDFGELPEASKQIGLNHQLNGGACFEVFIERYLQVTH